MPTLGSSPAFVDTNVLVYTTDARAPQHQASLALLNRCALGQLELRLCSQVVLEFVTVVVSPKRVAKPLTGAQAWAAVAKFRRVSPNPTGTAPR